jgi:Fic family protein
MIASLGAILTLNIDVKKVLTHKSGQFVFSPRFQKDAVWDSLVEVKVLCKVIDELPILPSFSAQIEEDLIRKSIFGTAAIEGNPLQEEQVAEILKREPTEDTANKAEKEIGNLKQAYNMLKKDRPSRALTQETIKEVHKIITKDIGHEYNVPGQYRNNMVYVGDEAHGGVYRPPKTLDDINILMKEFVDWINSEEISNHGPIIRAALAHYHFALIHPFADGNGRTARLVEAMLLRSEEIKYVPIMLSNYYYRNIDEYFRVFSKSERNSNYDITPFLAFFINGLKESADKIKDSITYFIRKFTLRDYYHFILEKHGVTQRQFDLLMMLLDNTKDFTLIDLFKQPFSILYRKVSETTAKRDLKKLSGLGILLHKDNSYNLNIRLLG